MNKYPKTYHLPFSEGINNDDRIIQSVKPFLNKEIVISEKLDGGNACLTRGNVYARTHSSPAIHKSFDFLKSLHATKKFLIPKDILVFGENLFAKHSIKYNGLKNYFYIFSVYDQNLKKWQNFEVVKKYGNLLGFPIVPILWEGNFATQKELEQTINKIIRNGSKVKGDFIEGIVLRSRSGFSNALFHENVAKWVRKNHIQTASNWRNKNIEKNNLL